MAMAEADPPDAAAAVAALFTHGDGTFRFARWGRRPAPMVYGTDDAGVRIFEEALGSVARLAGMELAATDPELGANFLVFFCRDWAELGELPALGQLIPGLDALAHRLAAARANQYRLFGFDEDGAIRACISLIRYDAALQQVPAGTLALSQALQGLLLWSDRAFAGESPIVSVGDRAGVVVKPWLRRVLRAAYDPALPAAGRDAALALRIAARVQLAEEAGHA